MKRFVIVFIVLALNYTTQGATQRGKSAGNQGVIVNRTTITTSSSSSTTTSTVTSTGVVNGEFSDYVFIGGAPKYRNSRKYNNQYRMNRMRVFKDGKEVDWRKDKSALPDGVYHKNTKPKFIPKK